MISSFSQSMIFLVKWLPLLVINGENYRQQRNLVTKIKKRSIKTYFFERCIGGPKSKDFWPTIKLFIKIFPGQNF
jgi:hypothetical protein